MRAAGCVERVEQWTGFQILPRHWGRPMKFGRPELCSKKMPEFGVVAPFLGPSGFAVKTEKDGWTLTSVLLRK